MAAVYVREHHSRGLVRQARRAGRGCSGPGAGAAAALCVLLFARAGSLRAITAVTASPCLVSAGTSPTAVASACGKRRTLPARNPTDALR